MEKQLLGYDKFIINIDRVLLCDGWLGCIFCEAACYIAIAGGCAASCEWQVVGVGGFNLDGGENLEELLGCGSKEMRRGMSVL